MSYQIYKSNGTPLTIADSVLDNSFYNPTGGGGYDSGGVVLAGQGLGIQMIGRYTTDYAPAVAQTLVQMTENFASSSVPADTNTLQGQLWFNQLSNLAGNLFVKINDSTTGGLVNWQKIVTEDSNNNTTITGTITAANATISGQLSAGTIVGSSLAISGNSSAGSLSVTGASVLSGTLSTGSTTVNGDLSVSGTFSNSGTSNLTNLNVSNLVSFSTPLPITSGGTGTTALSNIVNQVLPAQSGNAGMVLVTDGTNVSWGSAPSTGTIVGTANQITATTTGTTTTIGLTPNITISGNLQSGSVTTTGMTVDTSISFGPNTIGGSPIQYTWGNIGISNSGIELNSFIGASIGVQTTQGMIVFDYNGNITLTSYGASTSTGGTPGNLYGNVIGNASTTSQTNFPTLTTTTQAKTDNSTNASTTGFVHSLIGNLESYTLISTGALTIPSNGVGQAYYCAGTSTGVTLPLLSSVPVGSTIYLANDSTASGFTITGSGADIIDNRNNAGGTNSIAFGNGEDVLLVAGPTNWVCIAGSLPLRANNLLAVTTVDLASNGYMKMSNGFILQWGATGNATAEGAFPAVLFPIAFPNACLNVTATIVNSSQTTTMDQGAQVGPYTTTGVTIYAQAYGGGSYSWPTYAFWTAIGW